MKNLIIKLFNMEPSDIEDIDIISCGNEFFATITLTLRPMPCPTCGTLSRQVHDYYKRKLNHSVLAENHLNLTYNRRRYYCHVCQKSFAERNPFTSPGKRISNATVLRVMRLLQKPTFTFSDVASLTGLSTTSVIRVFDTHAAIKTIPLPRCLCIDEVYVSKYLRHAYACVLMDFDTGGIYDLVDSRKKADLSLYFSCISINSRNSVKYISMDMWDTYRDLATIYFPNAIICVDSFHVIKAINYAFDCVRIRIMKKFEHNTEEYRLLKKYHWLLKKSRDKVELEKILDLNRHYNIIGSKHISQENLINRLLEISPELELAYTLKNDYSYINSNATYQNITNYLDKYIEDIRIFNIPEFVSIAKTLKNWKKEIINSFIDYNGRRISNGPIESMNSRIKKIKRNANGYKNFYRFKLRCMYSLNEDSSIKF